MAEEIKEASPEPEIQSALGQVVSETGVSETGVSETLQADKLENDALKYHLLGPSLTKAGQDSVDQQKAGSNELRSDFR